MDGKTCYSIEEGSAPHQQIGHGTQSVNHGQLIKGLQFNTLSVHDKC